MISAPYTVYGAEIIFEYSEGCGKESSWRRPDLSVSMKAQSGLLFVRNFWLLLLKNKVKHRAANAGWKISYMYFIVCFVVIRWFELIVVICLFSNIL